MEIKIIVGVLLLLGILFARRAGAKHSLDEDGDLDEYFEDFDKDKD